MEFGAEANRGERCWEASCELDAQCCRRWNL